MANHNKVTIIGAGNVGATCAYTLALSGTVKQLVLLDVNAAKAEGDVLDISHGIPLIAPIEISTGGYELVKDSDVVVITAGVAQREGETRLQLNERNQKIFASIADSLLPHIGDDTILLVVTNPVDVLTHYLQQYTKLPRERVIGSGTVLDTSRFRYLLSQHTGIDARDCYGVIIGEHGDSSLPVWSGVRVGGMGMEEYCLRCGQCRGQNVHQIGDAVRHAAYDIISKKGSTYYAVAIAVRRIVECILRDERSILTVSVDLDGAYGLRDLALSVPVTLGRSGILRLTELPLTDDEFAALRRSAQAVQSVDG